MLQKAFWMNQNGEVQAVVRVVQRPWPHSSDGTGYQYKNDTPVANFVNSQ